MMSDLMVEVKTVLEKDDKRHQDKKKQQPGTILGPGCAVTLTGNKC